MTSHDYTGIDVYQGNEPYIFVSYAHKDAEKVVPVIVKLQSMGFRVWFDLGIEAGTEWSNNIAAHLKDCSSFLFFASNNSAVSENCLDEVAYAKAYNKASLIAFLEDDVVLPQGAEMQTARFQRIYYTRHKNVDSFAEALAKAPILQACRPQQEGDEPSVVPQPNSAPIFTANKPVKNKKKRNIIIISAIAAALVIGILCAIFLPTAVENSVAGTYYLTYYEYEGIRLDPDEYEIELEETYLVLKDDGTGHLYESGYGTPIIYNGSTLYLEDDPETIFELVIDGDELRLEIEDTILAFEKDG